MKRFLTVVGCLLPLLAAAVPVTSPDGRIVVEVKAGHGVNYSVTSDGKPLIAASPLSMTLSDGSVFGAGPVRKTERTPGGLTLSFRDCALEFRVFDDGIAWRWRASERKEPYEVVAETASFRFPGDFPARVSYTHKYEDDGFQDDFENTYACPRLSGWEPGRLAVLPLLVEGPAKMVIAESDVTGYPGMFLTAAGTALEGRFPGYPREEVQGGHNNLQFYVSRREDYLARCDGSARTFPWRIACIAREDKDLAGNDLVRRLAPPCPEGEDFSWVKPGKVAWEWWNSFNIRGADFTPGPNTSTYKAYIDFAARHGVEYVILDEGWSVKYADDLFAVSPDIDLEELVRYGEACGVGILLWAGYSAFAKEMEAVCRHYSALGVKGFKVDFLDRNDQKMMDFMYAAAETAVRHRLVLDFHGCPPPSGLERRFPNILNYEGIFGLEQMRKRPFPEYDMVTFDVTAPFIRFVAGPADYTPGAFRNASADNYRAVRTEPMSQGTRCRQLAQYVVINAPLQMLCDGPTAYELEPACSEFIYRVPTVWDETRVLDGKVGEYIVTARRSGTTWYIGALTGWSERTLTLDLSLLGTGPADVTCWEDGPAADRIASDWKRRSFRSGPSLEIHLAPGGGWAGIIAFAE